MFICMQKIKLIIHFFLTILHFKESCNLIGQQHFDLQLATQNYTRYVGEISITILGFIIGYFQKNLKNMTTFFKRSQKPYFGPILGPFAQIWDKNEFSWKKGLSAFQYSTNLPLCKKSEKPNQPFLRKLLDRHTKNQFISLTSLSDTANFRVLRLIEISRNLTGQEHFWPYLSNQNFPRYEISLSIQEYKLSL